MARVEKRSTRSWRMRYRRGEGGQESISGFDSEKATKDYANLTEVDQRRGIWLAPSRFRTT